MDKKVILILGGYGNTGRPLARLLLQESDVQLVLAGRNLEKAQAYAYELNNAFENNRVRGECVDASEMAQLKQAFSAVDLVVVASSTIQITRQVATAALEARIDYLDVQYSPSKIALLKSMAGVIEQSGCCFITDGGFHPGLPACLVRFVARFFDQIEIARVGSVIKEDWRGLEVDDSTIAELVDLINDFEMSSFNGGKWQKISLFSTSGYIHMDFGGRFGRQFCAPMMLEEMRALPGLYPSLKDTGFYVGSFNWFTDWVVFPISALAMKLWPHTARRSMSRWMHWGLKTFSRPPYGTLLRVEAQGKKDGRPKTAQVTISHPDGYLFTAIPVAACLLQYPDGSLGKPGLWMQALVVEPIRMMHDMRRMGIDFHITG
ncbi:MAG TPA: saccharopine dehydrogenase NADP-binding domain-containing protein, partial [Anaerolineales bacterium]